MKNVIKLDYYYSPDELEKSLSEFIEYYNNESYHESLDNLTTADVFFWEGLSDTKPKKRNKIHNNQANKNKLLE